MKPALRFVGIFIAWLVLTMIASYLWLQNPDVMPALPARFWNWVDSIYRSGNAEEVADMELLVVFALSGVGVAVLMALVQVTTRSRRKRIAASA